MGETDSCIKAFKRIIDNNNDIMKMSSAAQILTTIYDYLGLQNESHKYSKMFMRLNDSLDLGERQKTAFTTHNQFQYQKNKNQVDDLMEKFDKMKTGTRASMILSIVVLVLAVCIIIHIKKRNKEKLNERENEQAKLKTVIKEKNKEGVLLNAHVKEVETELSTFKTQAQHLNSELKRVRELLYKKNKELSERKKQSQSLMDTLYSSKLDNGAQDAKHLIITKLNEGKPLDSADWTLIYSAVDKAFPNFRMRLLSSMNANLDGKHMNAYYLACMGLSIRQIEKLTGTSRSSVSRILAGADWIKSDSPFMSAEPEE